MKIYDKALMTGRGRESIVTVQARAEVEEFCGGVGGRAREHGDFIYFIIITNI